MTTVSTEITTLQNQTAYYNTNTSSTNTTSSSDTSDVNMFLTLMLQQLQNQDPTEPVSNTEWLAQLAQYSTLEQMTEMNENFEDCLAYMQALYTDTCINAEITQTLSLIGKEVTVSDPDDSTNTITGTVTEASFEDGTGKIKIGDTYYSIANVIIVKDASSAENTSSSDITADTTTNET